MKAKTLAYSFISAVTLSIAGMVLGSVNPAFAASLAWDWNYAGSGITANGTFITNDTPDSSGFYLITEITGTRNGDIITGLQPTGTAIPGNEPFAVDNLISLGSQQLTSNGFGFSTAAGNYVNPFFADFLSPQVYLEVFSAPPFISGSLGPQDSELPISFSANLQPAAVPEPSPLPGLLAFSGLVVSDVVRRRCRLSRSRS
ncbi:MAG: hypothetical protein JO235_19615 [Chroococcidiopsidaceae cyanobacterium CP_BM_RX_35]|nr:hypothetical protein [Chroococcidiopsidaceae cyanobacterium CP_BM_RX_35]